MNDAITIERCPCESGLEYSQCCGVEGRTAVNAELMAILSSEGIRSNIELSPELKSAIDNFSTSPDLFPARVHLFEDKAWFIKMSPALYRESVFLDPARMKGTFLVESDLKWLESVSDKINWQPTSFIFHTAFCGSTLMAQSLEKLFNCLSLKEPELLGSMLIYNRSQASDRDKTAWFERAQKLLSRRYSENQPVVVKANDYANPVMLNLLDWNNEIPILFMYTPLSEFVAGCLKAKNRREWIKQRYQSIKNNLPDVFGSQEKLSIDEDSHGEVAAAYWSYNISLFLKALESGTGTVKSLNFNDMLTNPQGLIRACGELFNLKVLDDVDVEEKVNELFGVYSKNSKFKYSPQQRRDELDKQIDEYKVEQEAAEKLARVMLKEKYPENGLPNNLPGS